MIPQEAVEAARAAIRKESMTDEQRIQKALHQLDVDWGNGTFNYGKLRQILVGDREEEKA